MLKLIFVWSLACFFLVSAIVLLFKSKWNMGTVLMWALALGFAVYGIFFWQIELWTESGVGLLVEILLVAGALFYLSVMFFLAWMGRKNTTLGDEVALIVLGAGLHRYTVSDILERRLKAAKLAYEKNPKAILVVSGGQGHGEEISEALAMQRWLVAQNIPSSSILMETKSVSTRTNLLYSRNLLKQHGISPKQPIAVVTNSFHCFRARCYAKEAGFSEVRSISAGMNRPTFLQNYLREALALFHYWLLCLRKFIKK